MIVLGIDTGGTYTDAVLFENIAGRVLAKAKSPTTHQKLETGITSAIEKLNSADFKIDKVVLSTTLATNAIVENQGRPTGLIIVGDPPKGELPDSHVARVAGKVNVKGKIITPLDEAAAVSAIDAMADEVEAFAVSGMMSVRNASLELQVKDLIQNKTSLPVVCGHELSAKLGFHDRTVTTVLNASLIPIIENFILSVEKSLSQFEITAPVYMVKGDGNLASLRFIRQKPIESILSGPAASVIGALSLAQTGDGIVIDMGGTTTDAGVVRSHQLTLSPVGAKVGHWQTQVDSAEISTWGLGGDTQIIPGEDLQPVLTGNRILPACRGGDAGLTPTDLLHISGEYVVWDETAARSLAKQQAAICQRSLEDYCNAAEQRIFNIIDVHVLQQYRSQVVKETEPQYGYVRRVEGVVAERENLLEILPIIAIGAPAGTWYSKLSQQTGQPVIIPEHFEVANAVGAACASVEERVEVLVRPDEANEAYNVFANGQATPFKDKDEAVAYAKTIAEDLARDAAQAQGLSEIYVQQSAEEVVERSGLGERYVETKVFAVAKASPLVLTK